MPIGYRRPGVYLEESLLVNPADVAGTVTVGAFVGIAQKGPIGTPVLVEAWSDFVTLFGNFDPITPPAGSTITTQVQSYLPYSVYSFFQNGGRWAWIVRATPTEANKKGSLATIAVNGPTGNPLLAFNIKAKSVGTWGNDLKYVLVTQSTVTGTPNQNVFAIQILLKNADGAYELVDTFTGLSVRGTLPGTRAVDVAINDPYSGSRYVQITDVNPAQTQPVQETVGASLATGTDPDIPDAAALATAANVLSSVEGPINLNIVGYMKDVSKKDGLEADTNWVGTTIAPRSTWTDREDIMVINDSARPKLPGEDSAAYTTALSTPLGANPGDSYSASYGPWIIVPNPAVVGGTLMIPPGGAVMGMMARIDATIGAFRAPAGVIAGLNNALSAQVKFTDSQLGDLNNKNINVIRGVVGAGVCAMGARTRKSFGPDKYISARRTLILVKESLRRSTQWAVFENNDHRLWSGLRMTADRILRPMWEAGGLAGASAREAYYIRCDGTINTPQVVQSGEVRMEVGVALEYPAEFVIIRITQFDRGITASEVPTS